MPEIKRIHTYIRRGDQSCRNLSYEKRGVNLQDSSFVPKYYTEHKSNNNCHKESNGIVL